MARLALEIFGALELRTVVRSGAETGAHKPTAAICSSSMSKPQLHCRLISMPGSTVKTSTRTFTKEIAGSDLRTALRGLPRSLGEPGSVAEISHPGKPTGNSCPHCSSLRPWTNRNQPARI